VHTREPTAGGNLSCLRRQQALLHWRHRTCAPTATTACPQPAKGGGDAGEGEHGAGGDKGEAGGGAIEELALRRLHVGERATGVLLRRLQHPEPLEVPEGLAGAQQGQCWMEIGGVDKKGCKVFCHLLFRCHPGHLLVQHGHLLVQRDDLDGRHDHPPLLVLVHPSSCPFATIPHGKSDAREV